ncbi:MAG: preprotein translocase subunit SecG [Ruminococcaceae bacterium]|nr:preprotein translocase subunit SecG [Oscillospiraceae bacterium]
MEPIQIVLGVAILVVAVLIVLLVILQQSQRTGLNSTIGGGNETFLSKNKSRSAEAKLARFTKILIVVFFILVVLSGLFDARAKL